jgi:hypothetical protein
MSRLHFAPSKLVLALIAGGLFGAAAGCSDDSYYCDASGCYFCDGVGCRAVTPPSRATCAGDYQCTAGQVCTNLGCATTCLNDADCSQGWVCRGAVGSTRGTCVAPTEAPPTRNPGTCRDNTQCSGGAVCLDGTCARRTCDGATSSCACTSDATCSNGQVCLSGQCTVPSNACRFNSQCGVGRVCVNQECRSSCGASNPCPTGQSCDAASGVCIASPAGQCTRDSECGTGRRCLNATCLTRCATATDCAAGTYCSDQAVCEADTRRRPFCTSNADCAAGSQCLDGVCRRPCATADECIRTDVQYRNCEPIAYLGTSQRFCQTNNEVQSNCGAQRDCAAGQACVDGTCRSN